MAASVIQELYRWYRRYSIWYLRFSRKNVIDHVCKWQKSRRISSSTLPVHMPRSCLRFHSLPPLKRVGWVKVTYHEPPSATERESTFHHELCCRICMQLADAPVFANCCATASHHGCVCYGCAYTHLQKNVPPDNRHPSRCWSASCKGCMLIDSGPTVDLRAHIHYVVLDRLRDDFGSSDCFACNMTFETTAALRRHISFCEEVFVQCDKCSFYGSRREVAEHHMKMHEFIECPCCTAKIRISEWGEHVKHHRAQLNRTHVAQSGTFYVCPEGTIRSR